MMGITEYLVVMLLVSVLAGLIGSMVGVGGGIMVVPALTLGIGIPIQYAVGASIISVIATSSGSASAYVRDHITNIRVGMFLEIGTVIGSIVGVLTTIYLVVSGLTWAIYITFGAVLIFSAYNVIGVMRTERSGKSMVNQTPNRLAERLNLSGEYYDKALKTKVPYIATRIPEALGVLFVAGLLSGLLGIGSGGLKVLGMDTLMKLPFKVSTTTSNFMIGVTAAASTGILYINGYVNVVLAAPVAVGVVLGSLVGTKLLVRTKPVSIRILFIIVLVVLGAEMIQRGLF